MNSKTEKFIEKAIRVHGNKYDYSKVNYVNYREPVCITCKEHGDFMQIPYYHIADNGCKKCFDEHRRGKSKQLTTEEYFNDTEILIKHIKENLYG